MRLVVHEVQRRVLDQDLARERSQDHDVHRRIALAQTPDDDPFDGEAETTYKGDRRQHREDQRDADQRVEDVGQHAAEHHKAALGEIDNAARIIENRIADTDQAVDATHGQSADQELKQG